MDTGTPATTPTAPATPPPPRKRSLAARIGLGFLAACILALPSGYAFLEWSVQPSFCLNCHLMQPYYDSWEKSRHGKAEVTCVACHYEPGVLATLHGKITALNMVVKYATGEEGTKPWAKVTDSSCLRGGCHATRLLEGPGKFSLGKVTVPFDHGPHLQEMAGGIRLRCTSCHTQVEQGEHISVEPAACFLCHAGSPVAGGAPAAAEGKAKDPAACSTCHDPASAGPLAGGFDHAGYVARGVDCASCHGDVHEGRGGVPARRCASCHGDKAVQARIGDTKLLHERHVTDGRLDCLHCHTEVTHRLRPRPGEPAAAEAVPAPAGPAVGGGNCAACHAAGHGTASAFYRGEGGRGAPPMPSAMWTARVDCAACHRADPGVPGKPGATVPAGEAACLSCHGTEFAGILPAWKAAFGEATRAAEAAVAAALEVVPAGGEEETGLRDAAHDVALVRADGSEGAHNPGYAAALLRAAHDRASVSIRRHRPGTIPPAFPLRNADTDPASCASCHMGVVAGGQRRTGSRFAHEPHLGKGFRCSSCHSTGVPERAGEPHGLVKADCAACHHDPVKPVAQNRACNACHAEEEAFLQGRRADGTKGEAMMAEVACDACHGDPVDRPGRAPMKARCIACHDDDASYGSMVDDWARDAAEWMADAAARLSATRKARGETAAVRAAAVRLEALRRARPVHNLLLFEEEKEAFDDLLKAAGTGK